MIDWTKPIETTRGRMAEVLKVLPGGSAVIYYESDLGKAAGIFSPTNCYFRNIPDPPKMVPLTDVDLLRLWGHAFRKRGGLAIMRMNFNDKGPMIGGVMVRGDAMLDYENTATPWDESSWQPCGKIQE